MNILLTSVGRRSYLVEYFKEALGGTGKVIGVNMFKETAGMYASDVAVVAPPVISSEYTDFILDVCAQFEIGLICSLHDLDTFVLSQSGSDIESLGVRSTLPAAEWGRTTLDKYECTRVLKQAGFDVPWTALLPEDAMKAAKNRHVNFPFVIKSRTGYGSLGLRVCYNERELQNAYRDILIQCKKTDLSTFLRIPEDEMAVIQSFIPGKEICLGICNDLEGSYRAHFSCLVHAMRAGETDAATSIDRAEFDVIARNISKLTSHAGLWGLDMVEDDGVYRLIDVNPRFTGDYPFHHLAGANIPAALVKWSSGLEPDASLFSHVPGIRGYKDLSPKIATRTIVME